MTHLLRLSFILALFLACHMKGSSPDQPFHEPNPNFTNFPVNSSIRALTVVNDDVIWYAGNRGQFGYTENGGKDWHVDSLTIEEKVLEFRSIVVNEEAVFLLSVASPAILFKSTDKGKNWEVVYREDHPDCYYNSMTFWDDKEGIAIGDPIDGCLSVIITRDGGNTWQKLPCSALPATADGESGFAASNTNIAVYESHVWLGTGGEKSRVLHSSDRGKNWELFETPIAEGGNMTGIYSITFADAQNGIIFGGDWEDKARNTNCKAITHDGGQTWELINDGKNPGYRSCVQFVPNTNGKEIFAVGTPGISYSSDGGTHWKLLSEDGFYTIRITNSGQTAWLAGKHKLARMVW